MTIRTELSIPISGMTCASCVSHVEGALKQLLGLSNVAVNLATNRASISYDPQVVTVRDIQRARVKSSNSRNTSLYSDHSRSNGGSGVSGMLPGL